MKKDLLQFLSKFNELSQQQREELANLMTTREIAKSDAVVVQGQSCSLCFFVLKGCLRQYVLVDGIEKTTAIYTEEQAINYFTNQGTGSLSDNFLVALEDSVVLVGNPEQDVQLYARFPELADITRRMLETDFGKTQKSLAKFITLSPKDRYLSLLEERPDLIQRVPQVILASYLGITPESLSRIRKRILVR